MKWFKNLKLTVKLMLGFTVVAIIAAAIGFIGFYNVGQLESESLVAVDNLLSAAEDFTRINALENLLISPEIKISDRASSLDLISELETEMHHHLEIYSELNLSDSSKEKFNNVEKKIESYMTAHKTVLEDAKTLNNYALENPPELLSVLNSRKSDHYKWIWMLNDSILAEATFTGQLDGTKCALGLWLSDYQSENDDFMSLAEDIEDYHLNVHSGGEAINQIMTSASENKISEATRVYTEDILPNMTNVLEILDQMIVLSEQSNQLLNEMTVQVIGTNLPLYNEASVAIEELVHLMGNETSDSVTSSKRFIVILSVIGFIAAVALGLLIARLIKNPINQLLKAVKNIEVGDLNIDLDIETKDEMGDLAKGFNLMTNNMNQVLGEINAASDQVATGSRQLSDSSMSLSQGATEQASSLEELTASVEDIALQTKNNSEMSNEANTISQETFLFAQRGQESMMKMIQSMESINESSNQISKIIKVIDDIAFQTNILALNAAVEAARAGVHGKGFAVVAEEVRNLAGRSAEAAKNTTSLIENSVNEVSDGMAIANETSEALKQIVSGVEKAKNFMEDIAIASQNQTLGISQINAGLNQISDVVQTTSATAEETAAASEELSGQADLLKGEVAKFKLKAYKTDEVYGHGQIDPEVSYLLDNLGSEKY
jgi:methyl-accepting chemotaxis protein